MDGRNPITVAVGTAGYSWPAWMGPFYPENLPRNRMLAFHASHFPFVELHSTFLRVPNSAQVTRLINASPDGFQFSLKVPRSASHEHGVRDLASFREVADVLAACHRLLGLILELPEGFSDTPRHRTWLTKLASELRTHPTWVEFRHRSWLRPRLGEWLCGRGLRLATVDRPDGKDAFPRGVFDLAAEHAYVRLHSHTATDASSDHGLQEWIERLRNASPRLKSIHVAVNDCSAIEGLRHALRLQELIQEGDSVLQLREPLASLPPVQGALFQHI